MERRRHRDSGSARGRPLRLFIFLSLYLAISPSLRPPAGSQRLEWIAQSSGSLAKLSGVFFVDRDHGWVVGAGGALLVTEDGGATWRRRTLPERQRNEALNDVWLFSPDRGLLLGEYGLFDREGDVDWSEKAFLLLSEDRGANWEAGTMIKAGRRSPDHILMRMSFARDKAGWAVGESGTILRTIDGGVTWTPQESPTRKLLYDVTAVDEIRAWVVGAGGTILRTIDGGRNWDEQLSGVAQALRAVHFADSKRGWAVGAKGTIVSTANGGALWRRLSSGVETHLNDVIFLNTKEGPREGWIAGDRGSLLHTTDGGATWEKVELNSRANLSRLFFVAPDCGWGVGTSGAIFKYGK